MHLLDELHLGYPFGASRMLQGFPVRKGSEWPNQVWTIDITYIAMSRGFVCLAAVADSFSRKILSRRLSITLETEFCIEAIEEALACHDRHAEYLKAPPRCLQKVPDGKLGVVIR
jgi:transposase InsO family protein